MVRSCAVERRRRLGRLGAVRRPSTASGWSRRSTASRGPCGPGRRTRTRRRWRPACGGRGAISSRLERSKRSTRASSLGPTPYSAENCSVRWRRLQPSSAASSATPSRPSTAARRRNASVGLGPGAGRDLDACRQRPQHHLLEHGEALGPGGRGVEAVEQLAGQPAPQRVERHDRRRQRAGRQAEQAPGAGRRERGAGCRAGCRRGGPRPASCAARRPWRRTPSGGGGRRGAP